jgi:hypothetical protein
MHCRKIARVADSVHNLLLGAVRITFHLENGGGVNATHAFYNDSGAVIRAGLFFRRLSQP